MTSYRRGSANIIDAHGFVEVNLPPKRYFEIANSSGIKRFRQYRMIPWHFLNSTASEDDEENSKHRMYHFDAISDRLAY
jgi:hypothetical protein